MSEYKPSFTSEFKRGLNLYNLSVGFLAGLIIAALFFGLSKSQILEFPPLVALWVGGGIFLLTTLFHTVVHSYFGWRFQKGIQASLKGEHEDAIKWLSAVEWKGMDHYDEEGNARRFLHKSRESSVT